MKATKTSGTMQFAPAFHFIFRSVALLCLLLGLSGCLATYLVKSGYGQMKLLSSREDIEDVLNDPKTSEDVKSKLRLSVSARNFAVEELGLKASKNYSTFVKLDGPHVTYIVFAAKNNDMVEHKFSYPLVGKLPYKGYFKVEDAKREAEKFDKSAYDVIVRGVSAYSTLGWFNDPLLSSMIDTDDHDLVNLVIHESTHATIYIKSQAAFNERLATFVGNLGTEKFYHKLEGENSKTLTAIRDEQHDVKIFSEFISKAVDEMKTFYKEHSSAAHADLMALRESKFKEIRERFQKDALPKMKTGRYKKFSEQPMNNATLLHQRTYIYDMSDFEKAYQKLGQSFPALIKFCKNLEGSKDPEKELKEFVR